MTVLLSPIRKRETIQTLEQLFPLLGERLKVRAGVPLISKVSLSFTYDLTPALSSRRGRIVRRLMENLRDGICRAIVNKTGVATTCSFSLGGEG